MDNCILMSTILLDNLISKEGVLKGIAELMESPWYNYGKEPDRNFPYPHLEYIARKDAVLVIRDLCIKQEPTVAAMPVVRCDNCRHMSGRTDGSFVLWGVDCFCGFGHHSTGPDFYCADGELKHDTDDQ